MPIPAIVWFDLHQLLGADFDPRRTKAYVTTNAPKDTLIDRPTGEIRLGDQPVTINADGTGQFATWSPDVGANNPPTWQTSLVVDYPRQGQRDRERRVFGPYTITETFRTVTNKALTANVATLTVSTPHGLRVGDGFTVEGVDATFNTTGAVITAVPTPETLSYAKTAANVASTAATGVVGSAFVSLALLEEEQVATPTRTAQVAADDAAASKTAAAGSASSAATSATAAQTARTGAETARTGAETARTGAETARTGAESAKTSTEANINGLGIGTTTTGAAGSSASVTLTGTAPTRNFNFTIPRGDQGLPGPGAAAWTAAQAVVAGSVRQAPDGSWIKSTANRTTGGTFDATEQGFWTTVSATAGTMEQAALAATIVKGANVARFVQRARAGEDLEIVCLGDSILEGTTVTNPATDGTMKLLATDLTARFPGTITSTNYAVGGFTAFMPFANAQITSAIGEKAALYIVSAFDKNDLSGEMNSPSTGGLYTPGYPLAPSLAAVERIVRAIRRDVPEADIILLATNPYGTAEAVANAAQDAKDDAVRRIATMYGCEFVDANTPFRELGDWSALMNDSTHPNTAGHRLIADTILDHLTDRQRVPLSPSSGPVKGIHSPEKIKEAAATYGTSVSLVTGSNLNGQGWSWTNSGAGWTGTGGADAYTTSTTNDYAEFVGPITELQLYVSTTDADNPVLTVTVDGVDVATGQHFNMGKKGVYYVPIAVSLSNTATHTIRVKRTGGTLKIQRAAVVLGTTVTPFTPDTRVVSVGSSGSSQAIATDGSFTKQVDAVALALPTGWASAVVQFVGYMNNRANTSTELREFNNQLIMGASTLMNASDTIPTPPATTYSAVTIAGVGEITASTTVTLQTRMLSTVKTNCFISGFDLKAILTRTG